MNDGIKQSGKKKPATPTKTQETEDSYHKRAKSIAFAAKAHFGLLSNDFLSPDLLVDFLVAIKPDIAKATWRHKKAAIIYFFGLRPSAKFRAATKRLESIPQTGAMKRGATTSSLKAKTVSDEDFAKLDRCLANKMKSYKTAGKLRSWIHAGLLTGLRPCEWENAELIDLDGAWELRLDNAKHTNGRAFAEMRTLRLEGVPPEEIRHIELHLQFIEENKAKGRLFKCHYNICREHLRVVCQKLWPRRSKRISLYTFRHQFAADMKAAGATFEEVAAAMGHSSTATATLHYAKKRSGDSRALRAKPSSEDVEIVRNLNQDRPTPGWHPRAPTSADDYGFSL